MKMVKSLLLGTAAGLVAVAGAQAADLPVKAKPVQYVKICSLYGAGFYYIPGTDMCLKIGGWVRAEFGWGQNGTSVAGYSAGDLNNRFTNNNWWRIRGYITADARNQSEYGTIRSYIAVGISTDEQLNEAQVFNANRAFIQFAGFTFGRAASFYDFYGGAATSYFGFYPQSDTGDGGKDVLGYTAQFGGGWSASVAAEQRRATQIIGVRGTVAGATVTPVVGSGSVTGGGGGVGYGGWQVPDFTGNLRIDQPWGSAQIMGALHQVNATYYDNSVTGAPTYLPEGSGHPSDKWGFAVGAGIKLLTPFISPGDYLHAQVNYTQGALRYIFQNDNGNHYLQENQHSAALGVLSDAVYGGCVIASTGCAVVGTATDLNLTTAWGFNAAYEHFWSKQWRTSIHGGWYEVSYNGQANAIICSAWGGNPGIAGLNGAGIGSAAVAASGCSADWSLWWIGSRTQWNITPDTYLGLDVAYINIDSASSFNGLTTPAMVGGAGITNSGPRPLESQQAWQARFRVHRDFYP